MDIPTTDLLPPTAPGEIVTSITLEETTLDELDGRLPASGLAFEFHQPNVGTLRRLGSFASDKDLVRRPGQFIAVYLAAALAKLGDHDMGPVERNADAAARVSALPAGDVLTMLVAWTHRKSRSGAPLTGLGCGACGASWPTVRVDLGALPVWRLPAGIVDPVARVGLLEGLEVHGRRAGVVLVSPPTWGESLANVSREAWANPVAMRAATVQGGIRAVDALPRAARLGAEVVDGLMSEDLDLLDEALGRITASVGLQLEIGCPTCGAANMSALDWASLGFGRSPAGP